MKLITIALFFLPACWREYVGTYEIKDNKFYLVGITGKFKLIDTLPVCADWFTRVLKIPHPQDKRLHYVHMRFVSCWFCF